VHTLHLVARRLGGTPALPRVGSGYFNQALPVPSDVPAPEPSIAATVEAATHLSSARPETQALVDSIHYLLFTARHHLFHLLGREPLAWSDTVPPPVVDQAIAREAIMSVVRTIVTARPAEERSLWAEWEMAFDGDDQAALARTWRQADSRDAIERDIQVVWKERVGKAWADNEDEQVVEVEIEYVPLWLVLEVS
jgi:hypothetical protein